MDNVKTRDSILRMFFSSLKDTIMESGEEKNNNIPRMSDLSAKDWEGIPDSDKKELLKNSPARIIEILKGVFNTNIRKKKDFASGTSTTKGKTMEGSKQAEIKKESDDLEIEIYI